MKKLLLLQYILFAFFFGLKAQLNIIGNNIPCPGLCNATGKVVPAGNYHYLWNNGDTTASVTDLCPGLNYCLVFDSVGEELTQFGCAGTVLGQFRRPFGVAIGRHGEHDRRIFVADTRNGRVQVFVFPAMR